MPYPFTQSWLQVTRLAIAALLCPVTLMTIAAPSLSAGAQIAMSRMSVPMSVRRFPGAYGKWRSGVIRHPAAARD